jgi:hypothetical protein
VSWIAGPVSGFRFESAGKESPVSDRKLYRDAFTPVEQGKRISEFRRPFLLTIRQPPSKERHPNETKISEEEAPQTVLANKMSREDAEMKRHVLFDNKKDEATCTLSLTKI